MYLDFITQKIIYLVSNDNEIDHNSRLTLKKNYMLSKMNAQDVEKHQIMHQLAYPLKKAFKS